MDSIKWAVNKLPKTEDKNLHLMSKQESQKVRAFHESFPQYTKTPLVKLDNMAKLIGVKDIFVKDESYRFGLNSFKVLGCSYAMAKYIAKKTNKDISELPYSVLKSEKLREEFGQATFFTATDGNHGRAVAWAAKMLGQKCVVYMPIGTTQNRLNNIAKENATVTIENLNYDDCVRKASESAKEIENAVIVQDTAWDGYEDIPTWIMQGYGTIAYEADEQLENYGCKRPTHIFVQAGVGAMAGSVQGYFANRYADCEPIVVVVEPSVAACLYESALAGDGSPHNVTGEMLSLMNGLACGEPCTISWDILKNHANTFVSCEDFITARGMRLLAAPVKGDTPVTSGESGAVTMGLLYTIMTDDNYKELREQLKLDADSEILLFSTEGNTDPDRYRQIVWNGLNSL